MTSAAAPPKRYAAGGAARATRSGPAAGGCSAGRNGSPIPSGEDVHKLDTFDADGDLVAAWITKNCSAM